MNSDAGPRKRLHGRHFFQDEAIEFCVPAMIPSPYAARVCKQNKIVKTNVFLDTTQQIKATCLSRSFTTEKRDWYTQQNRIFFRKRKQTLPCDPLYHLSAYKELPSRS